MEKQTEFNDAAYRSDHNGVFDENTTMLGHCEYFKLYFGIVGKQHDR